MFAISGRLLRMSRASCPRAQDSTLSGNMAANNGGAVTCLSCADLSAVTTTFANNTAADGYGGGVQCVFIFKRSCGCCCHGSVETMDFGGSSAVLTCIVESRAAQQTALIHALDERSGVLRSA